MNLWSIFNKNYFNNILNFDENVLIDIHLFMIIIKLYFGKKLLSYQYDNYSDIWGANKINKDNNFRIWKKYVK